MYVCARELTPPPPPPKQSAITNEICEIVAGASSVDSDKGGNSKVRSGFVCLFKPSPIHGVDNARKSGLAHLDDSLTHSQHTHQTTKLQELLAYEYESGDEFEAERIRDFAEWYATLDDFKENLLQDA